VAHGAALVENDQAVLGALDHGFKELDAGRQALRA